ncbi:hypothetical protein A2852_02330 [Candidatus Adlerbacteria bacterium RIFCSPHIGHO2_01_FULL_54_23]|uniref:M23ase beta-sheet core domain-containing protein n=3 Tax=Candidatus Adleribacteriota TaxID=1752736 RepID=A0A1F4Y2P8_9BACT|nr:MAG: hypothetical protein UY83_C0002G0061 [Candidatus Adlerbacteria bacterium GW2011_GWA1_54_10]KKW37955.1 MAG: hypothetical protein UY86_C0002G0052 [Candidatus Adlerbacteria bacterium GW2011_GWB1_54_7]OGC78563.1 MAG: hypothetical protein A2852_02330 [Candidatus Adlerbacteria bacterium RIFCSPHIGHO2_01_FULL_54_23]OGC87573.1 MAG: hypothetical protein A3B33_01525 [Candidatus Adlerbacteria bacterium RIFCSPLOWO2_01_FULL_54_16]
MARFLLLALFLLLPVWAIAQTPEEIQQSIEKSNAEIERLRQEIAVLQRDLNAVGEQKQTLQSAIKGIDLQVQKLTKSIALTNAQIAQKDREIRALAGDITETGADIIQSQGGVAESLRELDKLDREPLAGLLLEGVSLSALFDQAATLSSMRSQLQNRIEDLSALKTNLQDTKTNAENKRRELANLQSKLSQEKQGLTLARAEQNKLLAETKNKESNYQALITQKREEEERFERQLRAFEEQLGLSVPAGSIPTPRPGVLQWPVAAPHITQYFGNTPFATANPQIYGNRGHNAIDLRAAPGTPIFSARGGVVAGTGNTDLTCPNASYGKWVFVEHDNGLSTLYAHLSQISVSQGQAVGAAQTIGFSGSTGYATGPHLHFGVYATGGAKITSFPSQSCRGRTYTMPVADQTAYLNPLSYLPTL